MDPKQAHPFPAEAAEKRMIALRFWLQGRGYHRALRAMDYNRRLFTGLRKDGITPEFDHHVCQAQYMRTLLPFVTYPEETLATIFFHDTPEDIGVSFDEIVNFFKQDLEFGLRVSDGTRRVTKKMRNVKLQAEPLFRSMAECPIASLVKGGDRIHNLQSMIRTFNDDKQRQYLAETEEYILPMLKTAEQNFPEQEPAYKNIRTILKMQVDMVAHSLGKRA
jgi:(p)ppGpp synthase/HD superfamily hydrolase